MSRHLASLLLARLSPFPPAGRSLPAAIGSRAAAVLGQARQSVATTDPVSALICFADAVEAGLAATMRGSRRLLGRRGIGLTGGLLWRGLAALTGIGLATALATAISDGGDSASLGSLTIQPPAETRAVRDVRQEPRPLPVADETWLRIARPVAMFGLDSPELERQPPAYEAHRSQSGARRQDSLSFGAFAEPRPHLELRLLVENATNLSRQPFIIGLVRAAAERGMSVQRSSLPTTIETRFGTIETADATLSDGEASRACIVFRKDPGEMPLGLSGWWCGGANRPADRQQLTCLLDRVTLLGAGEDRALRTAFTRTELNRQSGCAPSRLSAGGRKTSWLDADGQAPALKTAVRR